jgi:hypothetical protein
MTVMVAKRFITGSGILTPQPPLPVQPIPTVNSDFVFPSPQAFLSKCQDGGPERFAQEALGHNSKAVHRAYAKRALMRIPSLEEYEAQEMLDRSPQGRRTC